MKLNKELYAAVLNDAVIGNYESAIMSLDKELVQHDIDFMTKEGMPYFEEKNNIKIVKVKIVPC